LSFQEFLQNLKTGTLGAFQNQEYQFEELVQKLAIEIEPGRTPLVDVVFAMNNLDTPGTMAGGMDIRYYPFRHRTAKFDLTLNCREDEERLDFILEYKTQLFEKETIEEFIAFYKEILLKVSNRIHIKLEEIEIPDGFLLADLDEEEIEFGF